MAFDYKKYHADYNTKNFDFLRLTLPKGESAKIKEEAKKRGLSASAFVRACVSAYISADNGEK